MLVVIIIIFIFIIFGTHVSYPLLLRKISKKNPTLVSLTSTNVKSEIGISETNQELPLVTVIIPVHNEALVIERRINNIFESSYPEKKMEVIVVDSGSKDQTRTIIQEKFPNRVTLLKEEERMGKAHAMNLALKICRGDIVVVTDGPTLYTKDTIAQLVHSLGDSSIGGVSALYKIPNAKENLITASEYAYWSYKDKIRILESRAYSTSWLSGEACAFKKNIVERADEDTLADDTNIALHIISKGHKVLVNEDCYFNEKSPSGVYEYFRIKTRRTLGGMKETIRFKFLLFNRRYGEFGLIIFPYRFYVQFISPIISYVPIILSIPAALEINTYLGIYPLLIVGLALLYLGLHFRYKVVAYVYLQLITSIALFLLLTKRTSVNWTQSTSTRKQTD
jgi:cellulose synthase/poly-beta-1,6-N-acetylglucosamine synthase-like glycosyltransferase